MKRQDVLIRQCQVYRPACQSPPFWIVRDPDGKAVDAHLCHTHMELGLVMWLRESKLTTALLVVIEG